MARQPAASKKSTLTEAQVPAGAKPVAAKVIAKATEKPPVKAPAVKAPAVKASPSKAEIKAEIKAQEKKVADLKKLATSTQKDYLKLVAEIRTKRDKELGELNGPVETLEKQRAAGKAAFEKADKKLADGIDKARKAATSKQVKVNNAAGKELDKVAKAHEKGDKQLAADLGKAEKELAAMKPAE